MRAERGLRSPPSGQQRRDAAERERIAQLIATVTPDAAIRTMLEAFAASVTASAAARAHRIALQAADDAGWRGGERPATGQVIDMNLTARAAETARARASEAFDDCVAILAGQPVNRHHLEPPSSWARLIEACHPFIGMLAAFRFETDMETIVASHPAGGETRTLTLGQLHRLASAADAAGRT